jgi:hypothetical protein
MATPEQQQGQEFPRPDLLTPAEREAARSHLSLVPAVVETGYDDLGKTVQLNLFNHKRQPVTGRSVERPTSRLEFLTQALEGFKIEDRDHPDYSSMGSIMMEQATQVQVDYIIDQQRVEMGQMRLPQA